MNLANLNDLPCNNAKVIDLSQLPIEDAGQVSIQNRLARRIGPCMVRMCLVFKSLRWHKDADARQLV